MSYPVGARLKREGIDLSSASEAMLGAVMIEAIKEHLPIGWRYLEEAVTAVKATGRRQLKIEDPNSDLGRQLSRLLGTDIARRRCEEHFGVAFGLYNCCAPVIALTRDELCMTIREQLSLQTSANC